MTQLQRKARPKYLGLTAIAFQIRLPAAGWVSFIHRISGVYLLFSALAAVYAVEMSLRSPGDFELVQSMIRSPFVRVALVLGIWLYAHHFLAGIRFLLLDLDLGASRKLAGASAWAVHFHSLLVAAIVTWVLFS